MCSGGLKCVIWSGHFIVGPTGVLIQQHHYQAIPAVSNPDQHVYEAGSTYSTSPGNENLAPAGSIPRSGSQITFHDSKCLIPSSYITMEISEYSFLH
jgi:hypothetical protein